MTRLKGIKRMIWKNVGFTWLVNRQLAIALSIYTSAILNLNKEERENRYNNRIALGG